MTLIRRARPELMSPFSDILDLKGDMERLFNFNLGRLATSMSSWVPALDIYEDKDYVTVEAEVPGMEEKDVEISLEGNTLTIRGEKKKEKEVKEGDYYHFERSFGKFQRTVELPATFDSGNVRATYKNGVLEIRLAKREEVKPKQIRIEVQK